MERYALLEALRTQKKLPLKFTQKYPIQSDLILRLVHKDPEVRPSAVKVLAAIPVGPSDPVIHRQIAHIVAENEFLKTQTNALHETVKQLQELVETMKNEQKQQAAVLSKLHQKPEQPPVEDYNFDQWLHIIDS